MRLKGFVKRGKISPILSVPEHINKPSYFFGIPPPEMDKLLEEVKTDLQIDCMRRSCNIAKRVLGERFISNDSYEKKINGYFSQDFAESLVKPGVTTDEIDKRVHEEIIRRNCYPSPLNYHGFRKSICTSVNEVMCHGIPDDRELEEGDIVKIDISVYTNEGFHGDCADTFCVGKVDENAMKLVETTRMALNEAIAVCGPGVRYSLIGNTIESVSKERGFNVCPEFCGHGIGTHFHMLPLIMHDANDGSGVMREGMTFTIEPILTEGDPTLVLADDEWTAFTKDGGWSAQKENTILITANGAEILTL